MPPTIQLRIELQSLSTPIAGTVQEQPTGHITPFIGWLQLTETIEAIRRSTVHDPDSGPCTGTDT
jgi:hypothetical protein